MNKNYYDNQNCVPKKKKQQQQYTGAMNNDSINKNIK